MCAYLLLLAVRRAGGDVERALELLARAASLALLAAVHELAPLQDLWMCVGG